MYGYTTFGLRIRSPLALPELASSADADAPPDVEVRLGLVEAKPDEGEVEESASWADEGGVTLYYRSIGRFSIRDGREIVAEPNSDAGEDAVRMVLLGTALGVILHQRGRLVLHGSAVAHEGGVAAFVGDKGWGKSTMAAALHGRGYPLVSDDVVPVDPGADEAVFVWPGYAQLKLWPDSILASLNGDPSSLPRLYATVEKRALRLPESVRMEPLPLKAVYVLGFGDAVEVVPSSPSRTVAELVRHSYLAVLLQLMDALPLHFSQVTQLVRRVPVFELRRPRDLGRLGEVADVVENHLASLR